MRKKDFIDLYLLCFTEDSYEDAEALWDMVPENRITALYEDSVPCSMLVLFEGTLINSRKEYPLYYVYAACTHPRYRKQGKMEQLLKLSYEKAIEDGRHGLFLNPASEALVDYYSHEGFRAFSGIKTETLPSSSCKRELIRLSEDAGICCRQSLINKSFRSFIQWNPKVITSALYYSMESKGGAYTDNIKSPNIFILAEPKDNMLFVREAIGENVQDYIPSLADYLGCTAAYVRYPGTIKDKCFGMLLSEDVPITENAYMGIALD
jgi:hypothetical protein